MKTLHFILIILFAICFAFNATAQVKQCIWCAGKGYRDVPEGQGNVTKRETKKVNVALPGEKPVYEWRDVVTRERTPAARLPCTFCNGTGNKGGVVTPPKKTTPSTPTNNTYKPTPSKPYTGVHKTHYPNGKLKVSGNFVDGQQSGEWKSYYENGNLKAVYFYDDSKIWKEYYENGQLKSHGNFKGLAIESSKHGLWKEYYENGNLKSEGNYNNSGKRKDYWKFYDERGKIKEMIQYDATGKETEKRKYLENDSVKVYFPNGTLKT